MTFVTCPQLDRVGRLKRGNALWEVASTIGLARMYGYDPIFSPDWSYRPFFSLPDSMFAASALSLGPVGVIEASSLAPHLGDNAVYLQDYGAFVDSVDEVRAVLDPSPAAKEILGRCVEFNSLPRPILSVHVRRGDNAYDPAVPNKHMYHPLRPLWFYQEAMETLVPQAASVACFGDDPEWNKANIPADYYHEGTPRAKEHEAAYHTEPVLDWIDLQLMAQCQPPDTLVRTQDGDVRIEDLQVGDWVVSYRQFPPANRALVGRVTIPVGQLCKFPGCGRRSNEPGAARGLCQMHYLQWKRGSWPADLAPPVLRTIRGFGRGRRITEVKRRPFVGDLVVVTTTNHETRYTPDHPCIGMMGEAFLNKHLVYLMCRGKQFRVGTSGPVGGESNRGRTTISVNGYADPRSRLSQEKADAVWVLAAYESREEAAAEEQFASWRYGLPQVRFVGGSSPEAFWDRFGDNADGGLWCLSTYGRDVRFPFATGGEKKTLQRKELLIAACNLMPGMLVLDADEYMIRGGRGACPEAWVPISVHREAYTGSVVSLSVESSHTYVADGIVTHNCDYHILGNSSFAWWGAFLSNDPSPVYHWPWYGPLVTADASLMFPSSWKRIEHQSC